MRVCVTAGAKREKRERRASRGYTANPTTPDEARRRRGRGTRAELGAQAQPQRSRKKERPIQTFIIGTVPPPAGLTAPREGSPWARRGAGAPAGARAAIDTSGRTRPPRRVQLSPARGLLGIHGNKSCPPERTWWAKNLHHRHSPPSAGLTTPREGPPWARRGVGAPAGTQAAIYTPGSLPG